MSLDVATFRTQHPEFASSAAYPAASIQFYITFAYKMLNPCRWGDVLDEGASLWVAHFLTLDRLAVMAGAGGMGVPGTVIGIISGGTTDKVSYTREVQGVLEEGAGHWNLSIYGLQFIRFARMMGAGPIQVGVGGMFGESAYLYANTGMATGAWPGPLPGPY